MRWRRRYELGVLLQRPAWSSGQHEPISPHVASWLCICPVSIGRSWLMGSKTITAGSIRAVAKPSLILNTTGGGSSLD